MPLKPNYRVRALLALESLDPRGQNMAEGMALTATLNPADGVVIEVEKTQLPGIVRVIRANRPDCARSLSVWYREHAGEVTIIDVLVLPPIPTPPKETP
jgi:hypothetical protein